MGYGMSRRHPLLHFVSKVCAGAWFLTYAAILQPFYNVAGAYAVMPGATQDAIQQAGQISAGCPASFGS
jgi:hypothetical protein